MGIYREVETEVTCDTCGERIKAWCSAGTGVSRVWAAHYAKLVVLCNLCEEENKVVWQSEWDSYELLLGNYSDGKVDGTLRPYECKVMRSI